MVSHQFGDTNEAASGGGSSGDRCRDRCDQPPFPVVWYIEQYSDRPDGRCFSVMCLASDVRELRDHLTWHARDTAVDAWIKWSWHCNGRGVTDSLRHYTPKYILYVFCFEKAGYKRR